jgi:hypothetical protein
MYTGNKLFPILAAVFIVLAFVLRAVVPVTRYRFGIGNTYYRPDTILFWIFWIAGIVTGLIAILRGIKSVSSFLACFLPDLFTKVNIS